MTAAEEYQALQALLGEETEVLLVLASRSKEPGDYDLRQVTLEHEVAARFRETAVAVSASRNPDLEPMLFQPGERAGDGRIGYMEPGELPEAVELASKLANDGNIETFDGDAQFQKKMAFYALRVSRGEDAAYFIKSANQNFEVRKKGILVRLAQARFNSLEDRVFLFSASFDFVLFRGYVFLFTYKPFTDMFKKHMREAFAARAERALEILDDALNVSNFDELRSAFEGDHRLAAALVRAHQRGGLEDLTMEWVLEKNAQLTTHQLAVADDEDGTPQITFDSTPQKRFILTKILEEKVNKGELSGITWIAGSHHPG